MTALDGEIVAEQPMTMTKSSGWNMDPEPRCSEMAFFRLVRNVDFVGNGRE
jgi:hypothetical protein